jgi:sulfur transfer protein SufE
MKTAFYKSHMSSLKFHNQKRELRQTKKRNPSSINGRVPFLEEFTKGLIRRGSGRPAGSRAERDEDRLSGCQSSVYMYHVYM